MASGFKTGEQSMRNKCRCISAWRVLRPFRT
jgi:hypothetical protein